MKNNKNMKTKLLIIVFLFSSFLSFGQTKQVKVESILEPCVNYWSYSPSDVAPNINYIGLFLRNGTFYLTETEVGFYREGDEYSYPDDSTESSDVYSPDDEEPSNEYSSDDEESSDNFPLAFIPDRGCLFLFVNFKDYNKAPIEAIYERYGIDMIPNKHFYYGFDYNGIKYTLQADGEKDDSNIKNYSLTFCKADCQTKQVIVKHKIIQDAMVKVLFIGDLDGDSEPDIILNAPDN